MKLRTHSLLRLPTALVAITFAASAHAADYTWSGVTGAWTDSNWGPGPVSGPTSNTDTATIGSGIVVVNVNDLAIGSLTMSGGALQSGVSGQTNFNTPIQINDTGNVFNAPTGYNFSLNGALTGSGTASVAGQWAVGLGGDNSGFTGTWINGSSGPDNITRFDTANSGSASAAWVLNGGRMINSNNNSPTISLGSLSGTGGILSNNTSGQVTYRIGDLNTNTTFSGQIVNEWGGGGTTAITKVGTGTLTLAGNNSYSGTTFASAGTLALAGNNNIGNLQVNGAGSLTRITGGTTTVASNSGYSYVTGGGTIEIDGGSLVINGGSAWFSVGDHPFIPDGNGTLTLTSGSFTNNNSWGIVVGEGNAGAGFVNINGGVFTANDTANNSGLMLGNGNGASGTLNLNGGTLITDAIKGGPGSGTVNFNGGKLQATGDVFDIFQNNGSITTTVQSGGLKVGGTPNFAISEELGGTGALTKEDGNIVLLSGNNGYSGGTTISGGTLVAANNSALGTGSLSISGGTLQAGVSGSTTLSNNIQINGTGNVISAPSGYNLALNGNLTGSGTASVGGEWAVGLGGDNSGFTGTWINGNENPNNVTRFDTANSGSASAAWVLNGGRMINSNNTSPTISLGSLSGSGGILSNNTSGQVTYSVGGLNTDATFSGQIVNEWGGGGSTAITKVGSGTWTLSGNLSYSGATVVNGGNLVIQTGVNYAGQTTSGYALGNNSKLTFFSTGNPMIDKAITGSGDLYIDGTGAGNQFENRVNIMSDGLKTFSGSVYVSANGKLGVWGGNGSGAIPDASVVDVAGMVTFYGNSETIGGLTGSGIVQGHNSMLTVGNTTDQTFSGTLRNNPSENGSFAITKAGNGTLTLNGTNTYSGSTTISAGKLIVNGSISTSVTTVQSGATLGGSGTVGALTINQGASVNPGNSPGILAVSGNYSQAGTYNAEVNGLIAGSEHDRIDVAGTVTLAGTSSLNVLFGGGTYANGDLIFILLNDGTDAVNGIFAGLAQDQIVTSYGGFDWKISYTANSEGTPGFTGGNDIALMAVPEPSAALLGGLGMLALLRRRR